MYQLSDASAPVRRRPAPIAWHDFALLWGLGLVVLALDVVWPHASGIARAAVGIPFGLWAPGFMATAALFPHRRDLDGSERAALSLLMSMAATGGVVYGLSQARVPVTSSAAVWSLLALTAVASAVAAARRQALPAADRYRLELPRSRAVRGLALLVGGFALAAALIVAPAWQAAAPAAWLTSPGGFLHSPYAVTATRAASVTLHVSNPSAHPLAYRMIEAANGRQLASRALSCPAYHTCQWVLALPARGLGRLTWALSLTAPGHPADSRHLVLHYDVSIPS